MLSNNASRKENKMNIDLYRDPIWEIMDFFGRPFGDNRLCDNSLKSVIKRPHNLVNVKDESGKVVAQRLEVVTTPFKKEDVNVSVKDNVLSVACGAENIKDAQDEDVLFRGISSQSYTFALKLAPSVDQTKITAENKDGILKINLPLKAAEEKKSEVLQIAVN